MPVSVTPADFRTLDRMLGELKQKRLEREGEWQMLADIFLPRKDFSLPQKPTELRRRRLTSSVPGVAARRSGAFLVGNLVSHAQPFIKPNVARGLQASGRASELDSDSREFLTDVEWQVFDAMMLPESRFLTSASRLALELIVFGSGVQWVGRKRGFGPKYMTRPLRACWFSENEDGDVDTLFFQFTLPLWKAVERWPGTSPAKWLKDVQTESKARDHVTVIHAVYPRIGGVAGAEARAKPYAEVFFTCDQKAVLAEAGYDSFPFAVPRLAVEDGSAYGTGLAWHVAPEAIVLHNLTQMAENAVGLQADPPLLVPKRMFGKAIDRRMGAVNYYDGAGLGFQNAGQAIQRVNIAGNVEVAANWLARLEGNVEGGLLTDWVRLRDSGNVTAEEIIERRRLRLGALAGFIPEIDRDWMGKSADRTLEVMVAEGLVRNPPRQLSEVDTDWDYAGPLAQEQLRGQVDGFQLAARMALETRDLDPSAVYALNVEEGLRSVFEAVALPPKAVRGRAEVAELRARDEQAKILAQNAELAEMAGRALSAGGQGAANLATADAIQNGDMRQAA
ncbi:portal protein [Phenylobacterium sp. SCN 70-31]|uniref:portal protein n=1 Tax=Phenylobacterium sp. SCN 70-31 TaxID=1660129 RepID=UPI00086DC509|nr:portal protein [Phenylobacterium sp. SCN 70-31]ODT88115.1 MAG: hypothetical protein ABS78_09495 [Phenylobacterium sp. SCN 70-31]